MIDKGQKEEMTVLADAVKSGKAPVSFESLLLNTLTTIKAIESIKTKQSYNVNLEEF